MDLASMKRRELQALCKRHGLAANGANADLAARLTSHLAAVLPGSGGMEKAAAAEVKVGKGCLKGLGGGSSGEAEGRGKGVVAKKVSFILEEPVEEVVVRARRPSVVWSPVVGKTRGRRKAGHGGLDGGELLLVAEVRREGEGGSRKRPPLVASAEEGVAVFLEPPVRRSRRNAGNSEAGEETGAIPEVKDLEVAQPLTRLRRNVAKAGGEESEVGVPVGESAGGKRKTRGNAESAAVNVGEKVDEKAAKVEVSGRTTRSGSVAATVVSSPVIEKKRGRRKAEEVRSDGEQPVVVEEKAAKVEVSGRTTRSGSVAATVVSSPVIEKMRGRRKAEEVCSDGEQPVVVEEKAAKVEVSGRTTRSGSVSDSVVLPPVIEKKRGRRKAEDVHSDVEQPVVVEEKTAKVEVSGKTRRSGSVAAAVVPSPFVENKRGRRKAEDVRLDRELPVVAEVPRDDAPVSRSLRNRVIVVEGKDSTKEATPVGNKLEKEEKPGRRATRKRPQLAASAEEEAVVPCEEPPLRRSRRNLSEAEDLSVENANSEVCPETRAAAEVKNLKLSQPSTRSRRNAGKASGEEDVISLAAGGARGDEHVAVGRRNTWRRNTEKKVAVNAGDIACSGRSGKVADTEKQPEVKEPVRRSTRKSVDPALLDREIKGPDETVRRQELARGKGADTEKQPEVKEPVRRSTRKSLVLALLDKEIKGPDETVRRQELANGKGSTTEKQPEVKEPAKRSTRKSVVPAVLDKETKDADEMVRREEFGIRAKNSRTRTQSREHEVAAHASEMKLQADVVAQNHGGLRRSTRNASTHNPSDNNKVPPHIGENVVHDEVGEGNKKSRKRRAAAMEISSSLAENSLNNEINEGQKSRTQQKVRTPKKFGNKEQHMADSPTPVVYAEALQDHEKPETPQQQSRGAVSRGRPAKKRRTTASQEVVMPVEEPTADGTVIREALLEENEVTDQYSQEPCTKSHGITQDNDIERQELSSASVPALSPEETCRVPNVNEEIHVPEARDVQKSGHNRESSQPSVIENEDQCMEIQKCGDIQTGNIASSEVSVGALDQLSSIAEAVPSTSVAVVLESKAPVDEGAKEAGMKNTEDIQTQNIASSEDIVGALEQSSNIAEAVPSTSVAVVSESKAPVDEDAKEAGMKNIEDSQTVNVVSSEDSLGAFDKSPSIAEAVPSTSAAVILESDAPVEEDANEVGAKNTEDIQTVNVASSEDSLGASGKLPSLEVPSTSAAAVLDSDDVLTDEDTNEAGMKNTGAPSSPFVAGSLGDQCSADQLTKSIEVSLPESHPDVLLSVVVDTEKQSDDLEVQYHSGECTISTLFGGAVGVASEYGSHGDDKDTAVTPAEKQVSGSVDGDDIESRGSGLVGGSESTFANALNPEDIDGGHEANISSLVHSDIEAAEADEGLIESSLEGKASVDERSAISSPLHSNSPQKQEVHVASPGNVGVEIVSSATVADSSKTNAAASHLGKVIETITAVPVPDAALLVDDSAHSSKIQDEEPEAAEEKDFHCVVTGNSPSKHHEFSSDVTNTEDLPSLHGNSNNDPVSHDSTIGGHEEQFLTASPVAAQKMVSEETNVDESPQKATADIDASDGLPTECLQDDADHVHGEQVDLLTEEIAPDNMARISSFSQTSLQVFEVAGDTGDFVYPKSERWRSEDGGIGSPEIGAHPYSPSIEKTLEGHTENCLSLVTDDGLDLRVDDPEVKHQAVDADLSAPSIMDNEVREDNHGATCDVLDKEVTNLDNVPAEIDADREFSQAGNYEEAISHSDEFSMPSDDLHIQEQASLPDDSTFQMDYDDFEFDPMEPEDLTVAVEDQGTSSKKSTVEATTTFEESNAANAIETMEEKFSQEGLLDEPVLGQQVGSIEIERSIELSNDRSDAFLNLGESFSLQETKDLAGNLSSQSSYFEGTDEDVYTSPKEEIMKYSEDQECVEDKDSEENAIGCVDTEKIEQQETVTSSAEPNESDIQVDPLTFGILFQGVDAKEATPCSTSESIKHGNSPKLLASGLGVDPHQRISPSEHGESVAEKSTQATDSGNCGSNEKGENPLSTIVQAEEAAEGKNAYLTESGVEGCSPDPRPSLFGLEALFAEESKESSMINDEFAAGKIDYHNESGDYRTAGLQPESERCHHVEDEQLVEDNSYRKLALEQDGEPEAALKNTSLSSTTSESKHEQSLVEEAVHSMKNDLEGCSSKQRRLSLGLQSLFVQESMDDSMPNDVLALARVNCENSTVDEAKDRHIECEVEKTTILQPDSDEGPHEDGEVDENRDCIKLATQQGNEKEGSPESCHEEGWVAPGAQLDSLEDLNHMEREIIDEEMACKEEVYGIKPMPLSDSNDFPEKLSVNEPTGHASTASEAQTSGLQTAPVNDEVDLGYNSSPIESLDKEGKNDRHIFQLESKGDAAVTSPLVAESGEQALDECIECYSSEAPYQGYEEQCNEQIDIPTFDTIDFSATEESKSELTLLPAEDTLPLSDEQQLEVKEVEEFCLSWDDDLSDICEIGSFENSIDKRSPCNLLKDSQIDSCQKMELPNDESIQKSPVESSVCPDKSVSRSGEICQTSGRRRIEEISCKLLSFRISSAVKGRKKTGMSGTTKNQVGNLSQSAVDVFRAKENTPSVKTDSHLEKNFDRSVVRNSSRRPLQTIYSEPQSGDDDMI